MSEPTLYQRVGEPARIKGRKKVGGYRYVPVEPDAWGIKSWGQLYRSMTLAETGGDWKECTDALGSALGIGDNDDG